MHLAATLSSLPLPFEQAVARIAELGFTHADVTAQVERPPVDLEALAGSGLFISCAALGRNLPPGLALDAPSVADRRAAVELVGQQIADAARLGASHCYLVSGMDGSPKALARLADSCAALVDHAESRMVRLCVEHFPGRALPTVEATLKWLDREQLDEVRLLLDVGHCLISEEDPTQAAVRAGPWLGYVHWNDNDSVEDLHWPLLTGRLTADMVDALAAVLGLGGYDGGMALELNPNNADPIKALAEGRAILKRAWGWS